MTIYQHAYLSRQGWARTTMRYRSQAAADEAWRHRREKHPTDKECLIEIADDGTESLYVHSCKATPRVPMFRPVKPV